MGFRNTPRNLRRPQVSSLSSSSSSTGAFSVALGFVAAPWATGAASPVISEIQVRESVVGVKESVDAFKLYEAFIDQKDWYSLKRSLRTPPVSNIRRDCRRVISGLDGKIQKDTNSAYQRFIENLEGVDLLATRAIQNTEIKEEDLEQINQKWRLTETALGQVLDNINSSRFATPINVRVEQP